MRILYAHLYDNRFRMGGAGQVAFDLACSMKERFRDEVACIVNSGDLAESLRKRNIPASIIYLSKLRCLETVSHLAGTIGSFQPDIIHSHHRYTTFLLELLFRKRGRPVLHTEHVLRHDKKGLFRYGDFATAVSGAVQKNLISYYGVPENRVRTISNAVSLRAPDPAKVAQLRRQYADPGAKTLVLCVGRLDQQKGHIYLIHAVERLPAAYRRRLKILLAGDGKLESALKRLVSRKRLSQPFVFLGHSEDVPELLALCDFLAQPSLYEGMPLTILEAFSMKKTVIASDIPGIREYVAPASTGLLVPPRDGTSLAKALVRFMDHPEEVNTMGQAAFRWYEKNISFESMISKYHQLYEELLSGRAGK